MGEVRNEDKLVFSRPLLNESKYFLVYVRPSGFDKQVNGRTLHDINL